MSTPTPQASNSITVRKRDHRLAAFNPGLITRAIEKAFLSVQGSSENALQPDARGQVRKITESVVSEMQFQTQATQSPLEVERIQDLIEHQLMLAGEFHVARSFIVFREERSRARALNSEQANSASKIQVIDEAGKPRPFNAHAIKRRLYTATQGLEDCQPEVLYADLLATLYNGIKQSELDQALVMVARQRIERDPAYGQAASRLLRDPLYQQCFGNTSDEPRPGTDFESQYHQSLIANLKAGVEAGRIDPALLEFDLKKITQALKPERDDTFTYLGIQTLFDRYLIHIEGRRIETPQGFWMRVAMGLALNEEDKETRAIAFYEVLSTYRFVSATPTLFNSGTPHPQLSSCYLTTVDDDLEHIFKCVQDNAMLSKWAGGLGNDWTRVRSTGSHIHGTNGQSQGIVPFLKVANDTALAVNQGGKRKGAVCAYLETWHLDIEEFLELRKNTGDDRRRTHDMHTANWIPDLFMQRVQEDGSWTLFSPQDTPDLHDLYGPAFNKQYEAYEAQAKQGQIKQAKQVRAADLWRKMLSMVFETGHPWLTFKDPSNLRSPQDHTGVVHSSNLCTEILLNTSNGETAVCNLGSVNLKAHTKTNGIDEDLLGDTVKTAVRMLDNVIDINFYPTKEAKQANQRHRPIGLGQMGFQDALFTQRIPYGSQRAVDFADEVTEAISYHAITASSRLAAERGAYTSYAGSKWDRGLLPIDTVQVLAETRGDDLSMDQTSSLDWRPVREIIAKNGMRNSNVMAIAPTATISNIAGCHQSIEPAYKNLFVKSNLSGDFTMINESLVAVLKARDIWDDQMIDDLKHHDGELGEIDRIPDETKRLYQTAFEVDAGLLIEANSRRQKWIDMGISFNLYLAKPDGRALSQMYFDCWRKGLKTTYYLRSLAATQIEKSTSDVNAHGIQPKWMKNKSASAQMTPEPVITASTPNACSILDPDCEACQ